MYVLCHVYSVVNYLNVSFSKLIVTCVSVWKDTADLFAIDSS